MRIHYTGRNAEVSDEQKQKVQRKFEKVHKILRPKQSLEAHVTLSRQRHMCEAEVTLHALNHTFVVTGTGQEPYAALLAAADKLEKQAVKNKHKLIDVRRSERNRGQRFAAAEDAAPEALGARKKSGGKPKNSTPRVLRRASSITFFALGVNGMSPETMVLGPLCTSFSTSRRIFSGESPSFCSTAAATPSPSRMRPSRMCSVPI